MATHSGTSFREPRRRDRAIRDESWIEDLLRRAPVGVLALAAEEGAKAVPNLFVFDPSRRSVYLHTARSGETRGVVNEEPRVSFCVFEMGRLLPAEAAVDFSVEYASVVLEGRSSVVQDDAEARRVLGLLMDKYAPHLAAGRDYRSIDPPDLARTSVFRIDIDSWSGKGQSSTAEDAYPYSPPGVDSRCAESRSEPALAGDETAGRPDGGRRDGGGGRS